MPSYQEVQGHREIQSDRYIITFHAENNSEGYLMSSIYASR